MAKIQTIKNKDNVTVYPQTHTQAVYDANGKKLQDWLDKYLTAEDQAEIENIGQMAETTNNKTTIINEVSTDTQYPSAKAVYEAIVSNSSSGGVKIEIAANKGAITSPNTTTIYLIGEEAPYEEYLYLGNGKWELIGNASVDLSNYATKSFVDTKLTNYFTIGEINTKLESYSTTEEVDTKLENYSTTEEINTKLDAADNKYAKLNLYGDTTINIGRNLNSIVGANSTAEGQVTTASGEASHAEGKITSASGNYAHAEGYSTLASGENSHAEGSATKATNMCTHAEGLQTNAYGTASHSEGTYTIANNDFSHAEGYSTLAMGNYSHTEGQGTRADAQHSHVQGRYNVLDTNKEFLHIVGNGSAEELRSNAHTIKENGEAWFQGDVYVKSNSGTNKDEGSKKLATEEFVNNKIISSTVDIGKGAELAAGTIYLVYEE